ncbi:hypothetical protein CANCADRAFT_2704 [Tortispora caseinolytica NRRL Y-17796]|uniref:ATP-dependent (S)-NAD(P)H-hydrate dehydratase n=1 Tax=Tortispora caseinolytica NRRL Y-17796 TaxID=767744 RepID=A0A1E4TGT8_9ASCO|nr:hypothetical protein CANCADRAFT_2704 [Tortispora caseinolytica NRRL Y-17796]
MHYGNTAAKRIIPPLKKSFHKGQAGRIAVFGGSKDYTGAPYFSAMAATLLGADLSHVICSPEAAPVIKTYSPDLMVHPSITDFDSVLDRIHVLVVGPGLGRDPEMQNAAAQCIAAAKSRNLPLVVDADGLWLIQNQPEIIKGYSRAVLTPNVMEFQRLLDASGIYKNGNTDLQVLSNHLGVTIVQKGECDLIAYPGFAETVEVTTRGSPRRAGGQGDILSGCIATMLAWREAYHNNLWEHKNDLSDMDTELLALYGACSIVRRASSLAFETRFRAMQASDVLAKIGESYNSIFGAPRL